MRKRSRELISEVEALRDRGLLNEREEQQLEECLVRREMSLELLGPGTAALNRASRRVSEYLRAKEAWDAAVIVHVSCEARKKEDDR